MPAAASGSLFSKPLPLVAGLVGAVAMTVLAYYTARADLDFDAPLGADHAVAAMESGALAGAALMPLATQALADRPVDGRAYRVMAVATADQGNIEGYRALINAAVRWAPRDRLTRVYLFEDALAQGSAPLAVEHLDALLRDVPQIAAEAARQIAPLMSLPVMQDAMRQRLTSKPNWGPAFVAELAKQPTLRSVARSYWLDSVAHTDSDALLYDPGFERGPVDGAFGWRLPSMPGADAGFSTEQPLAGKQSVAMDFLGRSVTVNGPYQDLSLSPGRYQVSLLTRDETGAERPFAWTVSCTAGGPRELARLEVGGPLRRGLQRAVLNFTVPAGCVGQRLAFRDGGRNLVERQYSGRLTVDIADFRRL
ncbi:hypothetical protein V3390_00630 [Luteimonas sp. FXH3W]|uniref:Uncharacterized protein n=1 Tax=Aquilutibacter rugosus TaxID=3115820 RepID=A0ABU7UVY7_9GAMM